MKLNSYQNLSVPNFSVNVLCELLVEAGLDWRTALEKADIARDAVRRPGGTIPAPKEIAFQLQFVALTADRVDLWIRAARAYTTSTSGARGMALATAPTVQAWLDAARTVDYAPGLLEITPLRTSAGLVTGLEYTYPDAPAELIPFSVYRELAVTQRSLSWLYGGPFPFARIDFPLERIDPAAAPDVTADVVCGADALRLWWDPSETNRPLPYGNAFQHEAWVRVDAQAIDSFRLAEDWPSTVAQTIKLAPAENRKMTNTAAALRVSPRTLLRRLETTGRGFAQVRDDVLQDLAADLLLNTDQSIAHVSRTLGYADPASFTIAFKRWTGATPSAFRQASR